MVKMIHRQDQRGMAYADLALNYKTYYDALTSAGFSEEFSESMVAALDCRLGMYAMHRNEDD